VPELSHLRRDRRLWRQANVRIIPLALAALCGVGLAAYYGNAKPPNFNHHLLTISGVVLFTLAAVACLHVITMTIRKVLTHYAGAARAASVQFFLRLAGYLVILVVILSLLRIPVAKLLLGGAVTGIIIGVAAQQALANFFASVILLITRPYIVGGRVTLKSGGLGDFTGLITDIGLTHTKLMLDDGESVLLPNAAILGGTAIIPIEADESPKKR
jgi:small-conductance mechanosensitive channel